MVKRRRKRGLLARLVLAFVATAGKHGKKQATRAGGGLKTALGPKVLRKASEEYGGKRKANAPIPVVVCPVQPEAAADRWEISAMVGGYHVPFVMVADYDISELDDERVVTMAVLAACHITHDQRPIEHCWEVTQLVATGDAALTWFGSAGHFPTHVIKQ